MARMTTTNTTTTTTALTIGAGAAGTVLAALGARRLLRSPAARFARMGGSSIAAPDAAGWVTDFLNAAYYARPADARAMVLLGPAEMMHFGRKIIG